MLNCMVSKKSDELSFTTKLDIIKASESDRSQWHLANDFGIGKPQVGSILMDWSTCTNASVTIRGS